MIESVGIKKKKNWRVMISVYNYVYFIRGLTRIDIHSGTGIFFIYLFFFLEFWIKKIRNEKYFMLLFKIWFKTSKQRISEQCYIKKVVNSRYLVFVYRRSLLQITQGFMVARGQNHQEETMSNEKEYWTGILFLYFSIFESKGVFCIGQKQ